jgi:hypothetical protein
MQAAKAGQKKIIYEEKRKIDFYKAYVQSRDAELEFIRRRVNVLFGEKAWSQVFAVTGAPRGISRKEFYESYDKK